MNTSKAVRNLCIAIMAALTFPLSCEAQQCIIVEHNSCPAHSPDLCEHYYSLDDCVPDSEQNMICQRSKERRSKSNLYDSTRLPVFPEKGFHGYTVVGTVYCDEERACKPECEMRIGFGGEVWWTCVPSTTAWTGVGTMYQALQEGNACL